YGKCVAISTNAGLKEMILSGLITLITPILIGFIFGAEPLGGYMAGVCVSGVMWAIFQNNAGGAWDNAKKSFEAGVEIDGKMEYKGSDAQKAAVTGDTVGDPFKDTSGPSMNILIKLTCLVGLVIAPVLGGHSTEESANVVKEIYVTTQDGEMQKLTDKQAKQVKEITREISVEMSTEGDVTTAKVDKSTSDKIGKLMMETAVFNGSYEEDRANILDLS